MRTQTIIWTALPNGFASSGHVHLSVFLSPQLQTDEGGTYPTLSLFPDWVDWPGTLQTSTLTFEVEFQGYGSVVVPADVAATDPARWQAIFDPTTTGVTSYQYEDFSSTPVNSFSVGAAAQYISGLYGMLGAGSPSAPPLLLSEGSELAPNPPNSLVSTLLRMETAPPLIGAVRQFHTRPSTSTTSLYSPELPTLDFHQAVSSIGSYPAVLRTLGLAFDLVVPLPAALLGGTLEFNVSVIPQWTSAFTGASGDTNINVSPLTNCALTPSTFWAVPMSDSDYHQNGMLNLLGSNFSVIDLDVDGAAEQLQNFLTTLSNVNTWVAKQNPDSTNGSSMAMTVPALRSTGPSIIWSGWGAGLTGLAARQTNINSAIESWVTWYLQPPPKSTQPALPVLQAEDIIRGHRFDVLPVDQSGVPWRSLHWRKGEYVFGTGAPVALPAKGDEGIVVPGATTAAGTVDPPPPNLYVHESIARWTGWSLSAPRPGPRIDPDETVNTHPTNTAPTTPDGAGQINPQLSASFSVVPGTLPKLRFGQQYRYRARAVDLSGNSVPPTSTDSSTATDPVTHYRYEPVASPVIVPTAPLVPGEAVLLLALRNFQTSSMPVLSNGRWMFPPKVSELLAEEHGMLDGYRPGQAPRPALRPSDSHATYTMLAGTGAAHVGRADAGVLNLSAVKVDPNQNTPYLAATALPETPWLPDPLSSGVTLADLTGTPIVLPWSGGPWPEADPLLLLFEPGTSVTQSYKAATASSPSTETVTLPPAGAVDIVVSSAVTGTDTLGVLQWMLETSVGAAEAAQLQELALNGQMWMVSPYRVLRVVHAVRLPLIAPQMPNPAMSRSPGSVQVTITDKDFLLDARSTSDIDVEASWTDPLDDPSDLSNDPATAVVTSTGPAFKVHVPDPAPLGAAARPMEVVAPASDPVNATPFVHTIGDTKHHYVSYTCTATSRFAEFFRASSIVTLHGTTAVSIDTLGLDPTTVTVTEYPSPPGVELVQSLDDGVTGDYIVNGTAGTIALLASSPYAQEAPFQVTVSYVPTDTLAGPAVSVHVLSSAVPKPPQVVRVTPAWSIQEPSGPLPAELIYSRIGGYLRVYLERPWFSTGANELLGVVGLPSGQSLSNVSPLWVTMMGLDPISVSSLDQSYPVVPSQFGALATDWPTVVANRSTPYSSPPSISLLENPGTPMTIWPYDVNYDSFSNCWYADVNIAFGNGPPPPGYFVRLALVRFQPYSIAGAEISPVAVATFAQPVANRSVSVTSNANDKTNSSVFVSVSGPGYYGWRPPNTNPLSTTQQLDMENTYALHPYTSGGMRASSTMIVEVQTLDTSSGLSGNLAWVTAPENARVMLAQTFGGSNEVTWGLGASEAIQLPAALGSSTSMRLRISELDYYPFYEGGSTPVTPAAVNTTFRRPFVAFIPIN
jgi:hypothetical protein